MELSIHRYYINVDNVWSSELHSEYFNLNPWFLNFKRFASGEYQVKYFVNSVHKNFSCIVELPLTILLHERLSCGESTKFRKSVKNSITNSIPKCHFDPNPLAPLRKIFLYIIFMFVQIIFGTFDVVPHRNGVHHSPQAHCVDVSHT